MKQANRLSVFSAALLALSLGGPAQADDSQQVQQWLDRMSYAVNSLTYTGTLVFVRGNEIDTLRIWHQVGDQGKVERLVSVSGAAREVWRDRDSVRCIFPEKQQVLVDSRLAEGVFPSFAAEQLNSERYEFSLGAVEQMAGLSAQVINIRPRDSYRYGHRLWLERDSGMLLKSVMIEGDQLVEQLMFTQVTIGGQIADSELRPPLKDGLVEVEIPQSVVSKASEKEGYWLVSDVPEGFALRSRRSASGPERDGEHLLFSDGLASVSVYVERRGHSNALTGHSRLGAVNMFGIRKQGFTVTAVGEVPRATVAKMATSVSRNTGRE